MTKISVACIAGILFFAACENEGSSTVGTYEKEETSASSETKENEAKEESGTNKNENGSRVYIDTSKSIKDSANKKDTAKESTKGQ